MLRLILDQYFPQHQLQRLQICIVQVDHGVEVGIPLAHKSIEEQYEDDRFRQRQHDFEEDRELRSAVDLRGLVENITNALGIDTSPTIREVG